MIYTLMLENGDVINIDCIKSFSESYTASVTQHPVEYGAPITDHISKNNPEFSITGVFGDYNYFNPAHGEYRTIIFFNEMEDRWDGGEDSTGHVEQVRAALTSVYESRELVTISIRENIANIIEDIPNCAISNLEFNKSEDSGDTLNVSLKLTKVNLATVQTSEEKKKPERLLPDKPASASTPATAVGTFSDTDTAADIIKKSAGEENPLAQSATDTALIVQEGATVDYAAKTKELEKIQAERKIYSDAWDGKQPAGQGSK